MRRNLLAVLVAVGVLGSGPIVSVAEAEVAVAKESATFPLPKDAIAQRGDKTSKKSPDTRIAVYDVPRSRDAVVSEARAALATGKWVIVKDEASPSGSSVRLTIRKEGRTWKASFTGDDKQSVIIVTAPS
jgi:hypothetical protein